MATGVPPATAEISEMSGAATEVSPSSSQAAITQTMDLQQQVARLQASA
jgi:hypothetical protein